MMQWAAECGVPYEKLQLQNQLLLEGPTTTQNPKSSSESGSNTALTVYDSEFAARQMLVCGETSEDLLRSIVPKGTPNTFVPTATIKDGYKYNFSINGKKVEIKWHSQDLNAAIKYPGSNSGAGWTAQI